MTFVTILMITAFIFFFVPFIRPIIKDNIKYRKLKKDYDRFSNEYHTNTIGKIKGNTGLYNYYINHPEVAKALGVSDELEYYIDNMTDEFTYKKRDPLYPLLIFSIMIPALILFFTGVSYSENRRDYKEAVEKQKYYQTIADNYEFDEFRSDIGKEIFEFNNMIIDNERAQNNNYVNIIYNKEDDWSKIPLVEFNRKK